MGKRIELLLLSTVLFVCCGVSKNKNDAAPLLSVEPSSASINGVSLENPSYPTLANHFEPIKVLNATWITTMPFGFILRGEDSVRYNSPNQWQSETISGITDIVNLAHEKGFKVMLKPHIWAIGAWVGDIEYSTEEEWLTFEGSYMSYVLAFAKVAQSTNAEAFCIGVELKKVVVMRPNFWTTLIDRVRSVYKGKITYAANWDNYKNVSFWDKLDYIGIDAYFPTSDSKTPTVDECYNGWERDFLELKTVSEQYDKPIVFTEFGYRNIDYCAFEPWDESNNVTYNTDAQKNAYIALFRRFWSEPWFEGGFLWKWHARDEDVDGAQNNRFTPQNKPVEDIIKDIYAEFE